MSSSIVANPRGKRNGQRLMTRETLGQIDFLATLLRFRSIRLVLLYLFQSIALLRVRAIPSATAPGVHSLDSY